MTENRRLPYDYTVSITFEQRLCKHDIRGSIAHAEMLGTQGIITAQEANLIVSGLSEIYEEIEAGILQWDPALEDIHMNIESHLFKKIGDTAGKLHTARSRNDQMATDMRLYCVEAIELTKQKIKALQTSLVNKAEANQAVIIPGYTHLQRAQPVLLSHHLLAYFHMFQRDLERFHDCFKRTNVLPLGSGALAGVPYPIDRELVARKLGFSEISNNSMDAVSDRDFVVEYQASSALCAMHISRLSEELIMWSSKEFGFVRLSENHTTGSSIMPQKRNPDIAELARGKTGRIYGHLIGTLTMLKGLPLTYNRDLQEDKQALFDTVDTLLNTLDIVTDMIEHLTVNVPNTLVDRHDINILATDLADYLVTKGIPFRTAHGIVSKLVRHAELQGQSLEAIPLEDYQKFSELFDEDLYEITIESSINNRDVLGGTNADQVKQSIKQAFSLIEATLEPN